MNYYDVLKEGREFEAITCTRAIQQIREHDRKSLVMKAKLANALAEKNEDQVVPLKLLVFPLAINRFRRNIYVYQSITLAILCSDASILIYFWMWMRFSVQFCIK